MQAAGVVLEQRVEANSTPFFVTWLSKQLQAINTSVWLVVTEDVEELQDDGTWSAPRRRTVAIRPAGKHRMDSVKGTLLAAARDAAANHGGPNVKGKARVTPLAVYPSAEAYDPTTNEFFAYGVFPLQPSQQGPTGLRANYVCMRFATATEVHQLNGVQRMVPRDAAPPGRGEQGHQLWDTSEDTSNEVVEATLAALREFVPLQSRVSDGAQRQAFRALAARTLDGYRSCAAGSDERDRMIRRLIALPRMHLRKLVGSASPRIRAKFESAQLSGLICTQRVDVSSSSPQRAKLPEAEFEDKCIRSAYALARQGHIGRAAASLVRKDLPPIPMAQKIEDLERLHPKGCPPNLDADAHLMQEFVFDDRNVLVEEMRKSVKSAMCGSAPGPDGWTFELLHDALEHDGFVLEFREVLIDLCNNNVHHDTARVLSASSLVGIPKGDTPEAGTRPLSCGGTFAKVAAGRALHCARDNIAAIFKGSQFGCAVKGGAEYIVHQVRRFVRTGMRPNGSTAPSSRVLVTIDFANAFNTPSRQAMWEAVRQVPQLRGIFATAYRHHADLYIAGSEATLESQRGARQGTVCGPVAFALTLQQVLNAVGAVPGVDVLAFLDDVSLLCDDPSCAEEAIRVLVEAAAALGMVVKMSKCEVMRCVLPAAPSDTAFPARLSQFRCVDVVKLLGASIGRDNPSEGGHLMAREAQKCATFFARLRRGASPQFFTLLRQCGVPKLSYATRVHDPVVSSRLCQEFDARVEDVLAYWSSIPSLSPAQCLIMALPRGMGGMGLTRMELVAPAAFYASSSTALEGARRLSSQATLAAAIYCDQRETACIKSPQLRAHLDVHALDGSDAGLSCVESSVHPDVFGAVLRSALMGDVGGGAGQRPSSAKCPGCKADFAVGGAWGQHVSCCVVAKGGKVTRRHNAVVGFLRSLMCEAGYQPEASEPRDLKLFTCACGASGMSEAQFGQHKDPSGGGCQHHAKPRHASGPDIRWRPFASGETIVGDVTVRNPLLASHANQSVEELFVAARAQKEASYGAICAAYQQRLITLAATSNGHMSKELASLCNELADVTFRERRSVRARVSAIISHGSGAARLAQEELAGIRPRSIEMQQVRLVERFLVQAHLVGDSAPPMGPVLCTTPLHSLEHLIAHGVDAEIRRQLPALSVTWVQAALKFDAEQRHLAAESLRVARENAALPPLLPAPRSDLPALLVDDAETVAFREGVRSERAASRALQEETAVTDSLAIVVEESYLALEELQVFEEKRLECLARAAAFRNERLRKSIDCCDQQAAALLAGAVEFERHSTVAEAAFANTCASLQQARDVRVTHVLQLEREGEHLQLARAESIARRSEAQARCSQSRERAESITVRCRSEAAAMVAQVDRARSRAQLSPVDASQWDQCRRSAATQSVMRPSAQPCWTSDGSSPGFTNQLEVSALQLGHGAFLGPPSTPAVEQPAAPRGSAKPQQQQQQQQQRAGSSVSGTWMPNHPQQSRSSTTTNPARAAAAAGRPSRSPASPGQLSVISGDMVSPAPTTPPTRRGAATKR
jgi:hypothetical protein